MSTELLNMDTNGIPNNIDVGGYPLYANELPRLEKNDKLFGGWSQFKDWNCVLSGCLIDELNITAKTVTVKEGIIIIKGVVYEFAGYSGVYPFSIRAGAITPLSATFADGQTKQIGHDYQYTINTTFTGQDSATGYYSSQINEEIFFDPFTIQTSANVMRSLTKFYGSTELIRTTPTTQYTHTGRSIIGGTYSFFEYSEPVSTGDGTGRGNLGGFIARSFNDTKFVSSNPGTETDNNTFKLTNGQIKAHTHLNSTLRAEGNAEGISSNHKTVLHYTEYDGSLTAGHDSVVTCAGSDDSSADMSDLGFSAPEHPHSISGETENGVWSGLKANPDEIDNKPSQYGCRYLEWRGFPYNFSNISYINYNNRLI